MSGAREREVFYIIGEQTKGVELQGFWSGFTWRPGKIFYINRCLKAGVEGQGFRWSGQHRLPHYLTRIDRTI